MIEAISLKVVIPAMFILFIISIVKIISLFFSCKKGNSLFFKQKFNADIISMLIAVSVSMEKIDCLGYSIRLISSTKKALSSKCFFSFTSSSIFFCSSNILSTLVSILLPFLHIYKILLVSL